MAPVINVRNVYNNIFRNPTAKKFMSKDTAAKGAATLALISTLSKDALGCYIYVKQSFNNKEIPDNKRHFVTSLDLSNGICNVLIPLVSGPILNNNSDKLFEKLFGKWFNDDACKNMYNRIKQTGANIPEKVVVDKLKGAGKTAAKAGFGVITMLVYSQLLIKRIVTPTLSTPLADVFKPFFVRLDERRDARLAAIEEQKKQKCDVCKSDELDEAVPVKAPVEPKEAEANNDVDIKEEKKENPFKSNVYVVSPSFEKFDKVVLDKN